MDNNRIRVRPGSIPGSSPSPNKKYNLSDAPYEIDLEKDRFRRTTKMLSSSKNSLVPPGETKIDANHFHKFCFKTGFLKNESLGTIVMNANNLHHRLKSTQVKNAFPSALPVPENTRYAHVEARIGSIRENKIICDKFKELPSSFAPTGRTDTKRDNQGNGGLYNFDMDNPIQKALQFQSGNVKDV